MTAQQLPEGWQLVKFGEIAKHISKRVEPSETELDIYVGLEHLDPDSLKIKRHGVPSDVAGQKLLVKKGQIIFGKRRAYQRKVAVADWDCICSAHAMVLEANPDKVIPGFLPYFMQSEIFMDRAIAISEGSLSPTIKWKTLAEQSFLIPSKDINQKKMVVVLKKISELRSRLEKLKKSYSILEKAIKRTEICFEKWHLENLGDISTLITSGSRGWSKFYSDTGALFLRSQNIRDAELDLREKKFVSLPGSVEGKRTKVDLDDIVFTITGNSVGNVSRINEDLGEVYVSQHIGLVRLKRPILSPLIEYQFMSDSVGRRQIETCQYGQSKPGLSLKNLADFKVLLPKDSDINKYRELVERLGLCRRLIDSREALAKDLVATVNAFFLTLGDSRV
ncbi:restriction endonuclease subunit S [Pseudomonas umsongensis]|uniref:restriction endonuclease subunit S n=1 Tax=Pseudomonas umsongensis TaxID=198618 RepID=UPI00200A3DF9|nr:restriction endonuclease subunit S [Pseudomonas umsongensis]MCK8686439.1 restriction endonuclease subunit S [Pseudomonas umsongensis]